MKKISIILTVLVLFLLVGCQSGSSDSSDGNLSEVQNTNADFAGKRVAFLTGSAFEAILTGEIGEVIPIYCNNVIEEMELVKNGRADAATQDEPIARKIISNYPELTIVYPAFTQEDYGIIFSKEKSDLRLSFNEFLKEINENGVYDDLFNRWVDTSDSPPMPDIPLTGNNGTMVFATTGTFEPFTYMVNGSLEGFDVEMAIRFAQYMDMDVEFSIMDFGSVITAVQSGKADFAGSLFTITEERKQFVDFSDPYYVGGGVLVTKKAGGIVESEKISFWESLKKSFYSNLVEEGRWKMIASGLKVSLIIAVFAFLLATVLGFGVCYLKMSNSKILRTIGEIYITILRGTPIVVLLMLTYYVVFAKSTISPVIIAIIAFGFNGAAFIGEIIRSAILTVDKGQVEAARSMGFSKVSAFFTITFPQAIRVALPVYKSEFISMFKSTSIVGYIAIVDLTKAGDIIRSRTYDAFFPLVVVAVVYLLVTTIIVWLFDFIDKKTNKRLRRAN